MSQDVHASATPDDPGVVAVLVAHDGDRFLPRTLAALAALDPAPVAVMAVDAGSDDATAVLLADADVIDRVLTLPADTGFATSVHAAVDVAPASGWLWILHDDSAPEPDALGVLQRNAAEQPSVAIWGPKVLGWDEPRRLLEVGVSISRSGRRHTGLEAGEQDQGQYDGQRDTLAVGSAGMLVRRDLWSDLGGFDKTLRFFREDVDFGWRANLAGHRVAVATGAVVHHAEAMARGRRTAVGGDPHAIDRASALYTLLANGRGSTLLLRWLWLLVQTLVRALGNFLGKAPREAAAELSAVASVLIRPRRLRLARRGRKRWRMVPAGTLGSLFPPAGQQIRHTLETLASTLSVQTDVAPSTMVEPGMGDDDIDSFASASSGRLRRWVRRPGVLLFGGLLAVQLIAWRGLFRDGVLHGGVLLPMPTGASDVWQAYGASWHPVTMGSDTMSHPSTLVLAMLATLLLGHATWVVPVVLVVGPPLAGLLAYRVTASFRLSVRLRLWCGVAYALNPVVLAATAQGRWTTVLVGVLLPLAAVSAVRAVGLGAGSRSVRAAAVAVLLLTAMVALAPPLLAPLTLIGIGLAAGVRGLRARLLAGALVLGPVLLLLPWWPVVAADPSLLLLEPGVRWIGDDEAPWHAVFFDAGGWWSAPWWFGVGLAVAALAAVLRAQLVPPVRAALAVLGVSLAWALVLEAVTVTPHTSALPVAVWSGSALVIAVAASLVAIATAVRGGRTRLARAAFTWRQPALALVVVLAAVSPLIWGVSWIGRGAAEPLARGPANPLPAFVRAQSALPEQIRTLVLEPSSGRLAYTVLRSRDAQWGDVETSPPVERLASLDHVVADLASGAGSAPVDELADRAVQYVLALPPVDPDLEVALDSAPGLLRFANPGEASLWRVEQATGRVVVVDPDGQREVLGSEVPEDPAAALVQVRAADGDRLLELAELSDEGWVATDSSDGRELSTQAVSDWAQRFVVGAGQTQVQIVVDDPWRQWLVWAQLLAAAALVLVALPGRAKADEDAV